MSLSPYIFNQTVNYSNYLSSQIQGLGLSSTLDHIDTDSSTDPMTVTIWFQIALSSGDEMSLNNFMSTYKDPTISQNAINSLISAMNTDTNIILVAKTRIVNIIPSLDVLTLLQLCTLLGVNPNS